MFDVSRLSTFFDNLSYFVDQIQRVPHIIYTLTLVMGFNNDLPTYPPVG